MPLHRAVVNGVLYEVEDGERAKPRGSDPLELAKCGCYGNGCENIAIEYPGTGFVIRNIGQQRVRVGIQMLSGWDCGAWSHFKLYPGESRTYPNGGHCCPYEVTQF